VVDGAHNPDAARRLRRSLEQYCGLSAPEAGHSPRLMRSVLVIGASADKDIAGVVAELAPLFSEVIVTRSVHPRAAAPEIVKAEFTRHGVVASVVDTVPAALSVAMAGDKDLICVTGSLFVVAEALAYVSGSVTFGKI